VGNLRSSGILNLIEASEAVNMVSTSSLRKGRLEGRLGLSMRSFLGRVE